MAVFSSLSDRLQDTFDKLRGKGRLTEDDINVAMREIRMALLEADVNYRVVKEFVGRCKEKCLAADVLDLCVGRRNVRADGGYFAILDKHVEHGVYFISRVDDAAVFEQNLQDCLPPFYINCIKCRLI